MQRSPPGWNQPKKGPRGSVEEQRREEPLIRLSQGERLIDPHQPHAAGGGLAAPLGEPSLHPSLILGSDSRHEGLHSLFTSQSISSAPNEGSEGDLRELSAAGLQGHLCG